MSVDLKRLAPPWPPEPGSDQTVLKTPIYTVRQERRRSPRTNQLHPFYVIDSPDWVNVIPITPSGEVVLVAQWRHGISAPTIEIPSGMLEPGEAPEVAAARELREETGYIARRMTVIGWVHPNPATQSNRCATVLAEDVTYEGPVMLDPAEDIAVVRLPLEEVQRLLANGLIDHALVIAAFHWLYLHQLRGQGTV